MRGDVFVCDNARIHTSQAIRPVLDALLNSNGIYMRMMPKYSPELNPVELIFAQTKGYMRNRRGNRSFLSELGTAFSVVSRDNVLAYYSKCIDEFDVV